MNVMKSPLNSLPSSQIYLAGRGYLVNQYWFINWAIQIELKSSSGIAAISIQPVAGSIIVKALIVFSIAFFFFPWLPFLLLLTVKGPIQSIQTVFQGLRSTSFGGSFPYLLLNLFESWHILQCFTRCLHCASKPGQ